MNLYLAIGLIIASFFLGYWFCYQRFYVTQMLQTLKILTLFLEGKINREEVGKELDKIKLD